MSRTKRSIWTFLAGVGASVINMTTSLMTVPLVLQWLGEEQFGAFRTASDWYMFLGLIELGFSSAFRAVFAESRANQSIQTASVLQYGMLIYKRLSLLLFASTIALAGIIVWLVPVSADLSNALQIGTLCLLPLAAVYPLRLYLHLADARQHGYLVNFGVLVQSLLVSLFSVLFAWLGGGIIGQFVAFSLGQLPFPILLWWFERNRAPSTENLVDSHNAQEVIRTKLHSLNTASLWLALTGRIGLHTDKMIVALLLGPTAVVSLFATHRLIQLAYSYVLMIGSSSWAALAELFHRGERARFNQRLIELTSYTAVLSLAAGISTGLFAQDFVRLWVGADKFAGWELVIAAMGMAYLEPIITQWKWAFGATGKTPILVKADIAWVVVNIIASLVATYFMGVSGPLVGSVISSVMVHFWWLPRTSQHVFGTSQRQLLQAAIKPFLVAIPYTLLVAWLASSRGEIGWFELAIWMPATAVGFLTLCCFLVWDAQMRQEWLSRVVSLLPLSLKRLA